MPSMDLSKSSKHLLFLSCHKHQKRHVGTIFHTTALLRLPKDHQQASRSRTRLGITQANPKATKDGKPQSRSNLTVKKEMIHCLLTPLAHAIPVYHNDVMLPEIIQCQNFAQSHRPNKNRHSRRSSSKESSYPHCKPKKKIGPLP